MKILYFEWGSYLYRDLLHIFQKQNMQVQVLSWQVKDKHHDEALEAQLAKAVQMGNFDAVFSVNYFPVLAQFCFSKGLPYVSWSYDNPLNVMNIEETLGFETNHVYLFDRLQVKQYQDQGFSQVKHLPLAVNCERLGKISLTREEQARYGAEVSFVGNLYASQLPLFIKPMNDYQRGFLEAVQNTQSKIYGYYLIDELLTEEFMAGIQEQYQKMQPGNTFVLPREALSFALAAEITRKERLSLLGMLSLQHSVKLYSKEAVPFLSKVQYMGTCSYEEEMPKVFRASKINLNITLKILKAGIPLRALDILGSGGFLLTNYQEELLEHFIPEEELVIYDSLEDAVEKANFYLAHEQLRESIAKKGLAKVARDFTYEDRIKTLFGDLCG